MYFTATARRDLRMRTGYNNAGVTSEMIPQIKNGNRRDKVLTVSIAAYNAKATLPKALDSCLVLVLDSVTDPHNLGAVLRSADQFQASALIVPESRSAKDSGEENGVVARASAGASAWIPLVRTSNLVRAVERFKQAGFWVYGAEAGGQSVADVKLPDKTVFIMGSEGSGISRLLRENCDGFVSIPAAGRLDSLNVSVAAGILLYEFRRQKGYGLPLSY